MGDIYPHLNSAYTTSYQLNTISMKKRIVNILTNFGVEHSALTDDAHFIKDLGFDSLDTVDLMMQLEQEFNIAIPDEDYGKITTLNSLMAYLEERLSMHA